MEPGFTCTYTQMYIIQVQAGLWYLLGKCVMKLWCILYHLYQASLLMEWEVALVDLGDRPWLDHLQTDVLVAVVLIDLMHVL